MADKQAVADAPGLEALAAILQTLTQGQADVIREAMKQGAHELRPNRDNPNYQEDSIYRPKGVEKPPLRRRTFFKGVEQDHHMLTPEEVQLFNQLEAGDYRITIRGVPKLYSVVEKSDGNSAELHIDFPLTHEERVQGPGLVRLLRAILSGVTVIED
jgi:hypothetical protein